MSVSQIPIGEIASNLPGIMGYYPQESLILLGLSAKFDEDHPLYEERETPPGRLISVQCDFDESVYHQWELTPITRIDFGELDKVHTAMAQFNEAHVDGLLCILVTNRLSVAEIFKAEDAVVDAVAEYGVPLWNMYLAGAIGSGQPILCTWDHRIRLLDDEERNMLGMFLDDLQAWVLEVGSTHLEQLQQQFMEFHNDLANQLPEMINDAAKLGSTEGSTHTAPDHKTADHEAADQADSTQDDAASGETTGTATDSTAAANCKTSSPLGNSLGTHSPAPDTDEGAVRRKPTTTHKIEPGRKADSAKKAGVGRSTDCRRNPASIREPVNSSNIMGTLESLLSNGSRMAEAAGDGWARGVGTESTATSRSSKRVRKIDYRFRLELPELSEREDLTAEIEFVAAKFKAPNVWLQLIEDVATAPATRALLEKGLTPELDRLNFTSEFSRSPYDSAATKRIRQRSRRLSKTFGEQLARHCQCPVCEGEQEGMCHTALPLVANYLNRFEEALCVVEDNGWGAEQIMLDAKTAATFVAAMRSHTERDLVLSYLSSPRRQALRTAMCMVARYFSGNVRANALVTLALCDMAVGQVVKVPVILNEAARENPDNRFVSIVGSGHTLNIHEKIVEGCIFASGEVRRELYAGMRNSSHPFIFNTEE